MSDVERIKDLAISESGFVFDPSSGGTFTLNSTGRAIIAGLREGLSPELIMERLCSEFEDVSRTVVEDVHDFLRTLHDFGLLSG